MAEVLNALQPYIQQSERANASQLARWHRRVGLVFLGLGVLGLGGGAAILAWALGGDDISGFLRLNVAAAAMPLGVIGEGFVVTGVRDRRKANHFDTMVVAISDRTCE